MVLTAVVADPIVKVPPIAPDWVVKLVCAADDEVPSAGELVWLVGADVEAKVRCGADVVASGALDCAEL
jgi:hypothetical protein